MDVSVSVPFQPRAAHCATYPARILILGVHECRTQGVRDVMKKRIEKAASMDCDAIEPDNMMVSERWCILGSIQYLYEVCWSK